MNVSESPRTALVIGSGKFARMTANLLVRAGMQTILSGNRSQSAESLPVLEPAVETLPDTRLDACSGFTGGFQVSLIGGKQSQQRSVDGIVVAEALQREPAFADYGLQPSAKVLSLSVFLTALADGEPFADRTIVFVNGLVRENTPPVFEEVVRAALNVRAAKSTRCYVLTRNLKVAGQGLEALYREAKAAGVVFFKFEGNPVQFQQDGETVAVEFEDEPGGETFRIQPDVLVVDEFLRPSESLSLLAKTLDVHTDASGFLQVENVHRFPVFTNRRGIFAVGPARGPLLPSEMASDAAAAAAAMLAPLEPEVRFRAEIDRHLCIRCLTCFRICPYRAVRIGEGTRIRVEVAAEACEGCGICAAECPRQAIAMAAVQGGAEPLESSLAPEKASAALLVFCCARSSARAAELAECLGHSRPEGVRCVEVPCTGMISLQHLLAAFAAGARQVMVLACHEDNCHSEIGNQRARMRIEQLRTHLAAMGMAPDRLQFHTLAANMATEFTDLVQRAAEMD